MAEVSRTSYASSNHATNEKQRGSRKGRPPSVLAGYLSAIEEPTHMSNNAFSNTNGYKMRVKGGVGINNNNNSYSISSHQSISSSTQPSTLTQSSLQPNVTSTSLQTNTLPIINVKEEEEEQEEIVAGINGHDAQVGGADEETHCCENDDLKENHPQHKPLFVSESNYVKRLSQQMGVNVGTKHNQQNFKAKSKMRNQDVPTNPLVSPVDVNSTTVNHNNPQQLQQDSHAYTNVNFSRESSRANKYLYMNNIKSYNTSNAISTTPQKSTLRSPEESLGIWSPSHQHSSWSPPAHCKSNKSNSTSCLSATSSDNKPSYDIVQSISKRMSNNIASPSVTLQTETGAAITPSAVRSSESFTPSNATTTTANHGINTPASDIMETTSNASSFHSRVSMFERNANKPSSAFQNANRRSPQRFPALLKNVEKQVSSSYNSVRKSSPACPAKPENSPAPAVTTDAGLLNNNNHVVVEDIEGTESSSFQTVSQSTAQEEAGLKPSRFCRASPNGTQLPAAKEERSVKSSTIYTGQEEFGVKPSQLRRMSPIRSSLGSIQETNHLRHQTQGIKKNNFVNSFSHYSSIHHQNSQQVTGKEGEEGREPTTVKPSDFVRRKSPIRTQIVGPSSHSSFLPRNSQNEASMPSIDEPVKKEGDEDTLTARKSPIRQQILSTGGTISHFNQGPKKNDVFGSSSHTLSYQRNASKAPSMPSNDHSPIPQLDITLKPSDFVRRKSPIRQLIPTIETTESHFNQGSKKKDVVGSSSLPSFQQLDTPKAVSLPSNDLKPTSQPEEGSQEAIDKTTVKPSSIVRRKSPIRQQISMGPDETISSTYDGSSLGKPSQLYKISYSNQETVNSNERGPLSSNSKSPNGEFTSTASETIDFSSLRSQLRPNRSSKYKNITLESEHGKETKINLHTPPGNELSFEFAPLKVAINAILDSNPEPVAKIEEETCAIEEKVESTTESGRSAIPSFAKKGRVARAAATFSASNVRSIDNKKSLSENLPWKGYGSIARSKSAPLRHDDTSSQAFIPYKTTMKNEPYISTQVNPANTGTSSTSKNESELSFSHVKLRKVSATETSKPLIMNNERTSKLIQNDSLDVVSSNKPGVDSNVNLVNPSQMKSNSSDSISKDSQTHLNEVAQTKSQNAEVKGTVDTECKLQDHVSLTNRSVKNMLSRFECLSSPTQVVSLQVSAKETGKVGSLQISKVVEDNVADCPDAIETPTPENADQDDYSALKGFKDLRSKFEAFSRTHSRQVISSSDKQSKLNNVNNRVDLGRVSSLNDKTNTEIPSSDENQNLQFYEQNKVDATLDSGLGILSSKVQEDQADRDAILEATIKVTADQASFTLPKKNVAPKAKEGQNSSLIQEINNLRTIHSQQPNSDFPVAMKCDKSFNSPDRNSISSSRRLLEQITTEDKESKNEATGTEDCLFKDVEENGKSSPVIPLIKDSNLNHSLFKSLENLDMKQGVPTDFTLLNCNDAPIVEQNTLYDASQKHSNNLLSSRENEDSPEISIVEMNASATEDYSLNDSRIKSLTAYAQASAIASIVNNSIYNGGTSTISKEMQSIFRPSPMQYFSKHKADFTKLDCPSLERNDVALKGNIIQNDLLSESFGDQREKNAVSHKTEEDEDDDCDGVTLSPTTSFVSALTIPSCIMSHDSSDFSTSDEDTGAHETSTATEKLSSVKGPSEASSSQTSEAATPLIYSSLGTFNWRTLTSKELALIAADNANDCEHIPSDYNFNNSGGLHDFSLDDSNLKLLNQPRQIVLDYGNSNTFRLESIKFPTITNSTVYSSSGDQKVRDGNEGKILHNGSYDKYPSESNSKWNSNSTLDSINDMTYFQSSPMFSRLKDVDEENYRLHETAPDKEPSDIMPSKDATHESFESLKSLKETSNNDLVHRQLKYYRKDEQRENSKVEVDSSRSKTPTPQLKVSTMQSSPNLRNRQALEKVKAYKKARQRRILNEKSSSVIVLDKN